MSKRKIKDIKGRDLRDFPETEIILRPKTGPGGVTVAEEVRIPGREMPIIEGARAPDARPEEEYTPSVTRSMVTDRVAVSDARHVLSHLQGNTDKVIEGGRLPEHLTPSRPTTAVVRNIGPGERRDMKRTMHFIDSLQPKEDEE